MKPLLFYLQPWRKSAAARVNMYAGDCPSAEGFGLGGFEWEPVVTKRPVFSIELMSPDLNGKVQTGKATFTLNLRLVKNLADALILDYQGAPVTIYSVDTLSYDTKVVEFTGNITSARYDVETGELACDAEVSTLLIEVPLLTLSFSGAGGLNGETGKRGLLRPAGYGIVEYIEPVWFDETYNIGQIDGYGNLLSVQRVMEGANDLGASVGDYANYTALKNAIIAKTIPAGRWGTCIADGLIGMGAPPAGVIGVNATFGYGKPGSMMQRIVQFHAGVSIGLIDTVSFAAITTQVETVLGGAANIGYWTKDQRQVKDLLEAVAGSVNATPLVSFQGYVTCTRAVTSAPVATLDRSGSVDPRVINWKSASSDTPYYQLKGRTARPARVLSHDEVFAADKLQPMGVWSALTGYRLDNTVFGADGAEWIYINATPTVGPALPTATYPPAAPASNTYWQQLAPPAPTTGVQVGVANGATADVVLTSIGSQAVTIAGNVITRNAGTGDYNACVRGDARLSAIYAEVDIPTGANLGTVSLDDDATSFTLAAQLFYLEYLPSTGAWRVIQNNVVLYSGTTTANLTGKLRVAYDGIRFRAYINATQMGSDVAASSSVLILWGKWFAYTAVTYTGAMSGPYNSNIWPDISGPGTPANNATAPFLLIPLDANVAVTGNELKAVTSTSSSAYVSNPATGSADFSWKADVSSNHNFTCGFVLAANVASTTGSSLVYGLQVTSGNLYVWAAGVQTLLSVSVAGDRYRLTYDGVLFRAYKNGVEITAAQKPATAANTYFGRIGLDGTAGVKLTEVSSASFTQNNFSDIGGATRPADNATTDLAPVSIGSTAVTIVGNTFIRNSGANDFTACVMGAPTIGSGYAESVVPASGYAMVALDSDGTSYLAPAMDVEIFVSSGSDVQVWANNVQVYTTVPAACVGKKAAVSYDGIRYRAYLDGVQQGPDIPATAGLRVWPKWHSFTSVAAQTGLRGTVFNANIWTDIGGAQVPANNAGTTLTLVSIDATKTSVVGNSFGVVAAGGWVSGGYSRETWTGGCAVSFVVPITTGNFMLGIDQGVITTAANNYNQIDYAIFCANGALYCYESGVLAAGPIAGAYAVGDIFTVVYDGVNVYYYKDNASGRTLLRTVAASAASLSFRAAYSALDNTLGPTGIRFEPATSNAWSTIAGPLRPADAAGTSLTLVLNSTNLVINGNGIIQTVGSLFKTFYSKENYPNAAYVTGSPGTVGSIWICGLKASNPASQSDPDGYSPDSYSIYVNSGTIYTYDPSGGFISRGSITQAATDTFMVTIDNVNARYYRNGSLLATIAVTAGQTWRLSGQLNTGSLTGLQFGAFPDRYLDNMGDGSTYGKVKNTELSSGALKLSTAGSGKKLGDSRNLPNISNVNLGYKWTGAITYTSASGTPATGTISVAAGGPVSGSYTGSYNAMSVGMTGTNGTTSTFYLYVNDPTNAGGAQTLIATTTALTVYQGDGYLYVGTCDVTFPASGSGSGGGNGGGGSCPLADAWVHTRRGFVQARDVLPEEDWVLCETEDRLGMEWVLCESNVPGREYGGKIIASNGFEVTVSSSTPILTRGAAELIQAVELAGEELAVPVGGNLEWHPCVYEPCAQILEVAKLKVRNRIYAAGDVAGRSIMTHNSNPKP